MRIGRRRLFGTRVGRRIVLFFVIGAAVPVLLLALFSLDRVTGELERQSQDRLLQVTKAASMAITERLYLLTTKLGLLRGLDEDAVGAADLEGFRGVVRATPGDPAGSRLWGGRVGRLPRVEGADSVHLATGAGLLVASEEGDLLLGVADGDDLVWGAIEPLYLWETAEQYAALPTVESFCVTASDGTPLHCDPEVWAAMSGPLAAADRTNERGTFEWSDGSAEYIAGLRLVFLSASFRADSWWVVVSEDREAVNAAMNRFPSTVVLSLLTGLAVVVLLSNLLVRRSIEPLEKLREGTRRVSRRRFDEPIEIHSGDEFEELAGSFNAMGRRLDLQFRQLEAAAAIDQAVLATLDPEAVVDAVLANFGEVVAADRLAVFATDVGEDRTGVVYWRGDATEETSSRSAALACEELAELRTHARGWLAARGEALLPSLDGPPFEGAPEHRVALPVLVQREVCGAVLLARAQPFHEDELRRARRLTDQVGVALADARLVVQLEELGLGTLRALARSIDAKSAWTGGHSERVARLAVRLGRRLGLSDMELEILERGALLHDVGKIGVPGEVLDFPGRLGEEQLRLMRRHVDIGVEILQPIRAFQDILPLVQWHHERWNGTGYPDGLEGEDIPWLARILAVADAYDALASPRPYRDALAPEAVVELIRGEAGLHFDRRVVDALVAVFGAPDSATAAGAPGAGES